MTSRLIAVCFDANDPLGLARFWSGVLGWEMTDDPHDGVTLLPGDDTGFRIRFVYTSEQKSGPNQMHLDPRRGTPRSFRSCSFRTSSRRIEFAAERAPLNAATAHSAANHPSADCNQPDGWVQQTVSSTARTEPGMDGP